MGTNTNLERNKFDRIPVIVCAADDNYAKQLAVTVYSLLKHLNSYPGIRLFVIDGGISDKNKELIRRSLQFKQTNIQWISVSEEKLVELKELGTSAHYNYTIYLRLLIPFILPNEIKKAIYLDCDLIVKRDIGELWDKNLDKHIIYAAQDSYIPKLLDRSHVLKLDDNRITKDTKYFNTGVMVMNLKSWKENRVTQKTINFIKNNPRKIQFGDQDSLNAVLIDRWGELDQKWNCILIRDDDDKKLVDEAYVVHMGSNKKPWDLGSKKPTKKIFYKYLDQTAWKGWRPKGTIKDDLKERISFLVRISQPIRKKLGLTGGYIKKQQVQSAEKSYELKKKFNLNQSLEFRDELPSLLIGLGLNGEGVEIGVWRAQYSQKILYNSYLSRLYSIDPWMKFNDDEYVDTFNDSQQAQDNYYQHSVDELEKFEERSKIIRKTSEEGAKDFDDGQLDFVYIDAQHSYEVVKEDINLWWSKLKWGGLMAGHDYVDGNLPEGDFGVKSAVDEFVREHNLCLFVTREDWPTWYFIKEQKDKA